jgi:nucleoside-triphosphatase THEP1
MGEIILITGEIQSGKTNLCLNLYRKAQEAGIRVGGILSPAVFEEGEKTAIDILDLKSGKRKRLAEVITKTQTDLETQHWSFFQEAVDWGNKVLLEAVPCDLLIVDELGPLEFHRSEGWVNGFAVIESEDYSTALLVIRPSLIEEATRLWRVSRIINLDQVILEASLIVELFDGLDPAKKPNQN